MTKTKTWSPRAQKRHRKKLVAALRSGEYRQTTEVLTDGKGYCCLGVACEISGLGGWVDSPMAPEQWAYLVGKAARPGGSNWSSAKLPELVRKYYGFAGRGASYGAFSRLIEKNDGGVSFKKIADIIESEPEGLVEK